MSEEKTITSAEMRDRMLGEMAEFQRTVDAVVELRRNPVARAKIRTLVDKGLVPVGLLYHSPDGMWCGVSVDGKVMWWPAAGDASEPES